MNGTQADKIDRREVEDVWALSPMQEGLLFHYVMEPESAQYLEQLVLRLLGDIDPDCFRQSWQAVMNANEILRTVYRWEKLDKPVQIIRKHREPSISFVDLSELDELGREAALAVLQERDKAEGIDLRREPFRLALCRLGRSTYALILTYHHILLDGWSTGILLKEFMSAYQALSGNRPWVPPVKPSYKTFLIYIQSQDAQKRESFWRSYLSGFETKTPLPIDKRKKERVTVTHHENLLLAGDAWDRLHACAAREELTVADILYSAWGLLLHRYGNTGDIVFGTTVSGRPPELRGADGMVGLLIHTLPLRVRITGDLTVSGLLAQVSASSREREEHQAVPLADLKQYASFTGTESLFDSIVVIENYPLDQAVRGSGGPLTLTGHAMLESTNFPLALTVTSLNPLQVQLQYNAELFKLETVQALGRHFVRLLDALTREGNVRLASIRMLDEAEVTKLTQSFRDTAVAYPEHRSVHELFEEQAAKQPDAVALQFLDQTMTYGQLNAQANRVARFVRNLGIGENDVIGLMAERSLDMIVGIFGILKAGAAYVPIDPDYPQERIAYLLGHSRTEVLLTAGRRARAAAYGANTRVFAVSEIVSDESWDDRNLNLSLDPDRLIYVLYTSGSTGNPKGVMIRTRAFVNLLHWFTTEFRIGADDHVLLIAPSSFDLAQKNFYCTLVTGGKLTLFDPGPYDYNRMSDVIHSHRITLLNCSPSAFYPLIDFNETTDFIRLSPLREVFLGGEPIHVNRLSAWLRSPRFRAEIVNTYGPTECTDIAAFYRMKPSETGQAPTIPIGQSIYNTQLYVLDASLQLLPDGRIGELYIGGAGLAKGYYQAPELTEERFVPHPFVEGERLYRTGDLVRWLPDGQLDYIGRTDYQVKIRGMRIELAEIEAVLLRHEAVEEVVVIDWQSAGDAKYLCAYLLCVTEAGVDAIRDYAASRLPDYMVPSYFIPLEYMPLTPNGKIDKKALPEPRVSRQADPSAWDGGSETELKLAAIWQQILGHGQVGREDPFFEIGGNSILLFKLHSEIERSYPNKVKITDLFTYPTIAKLARVIEADLQPKRPAYEPQYVFLEQNVTEDLEESRESKSVMFDLPASSYRDLVRAGQDVGATEEDACLAMLLYLLLSAFSSSEEVEVLRAHPRYEGEWQPIAASLSGLDGFGDLFRLVHEQRTQESPRMYTGQEVVSGTQAGPSERGILPAFVWDHGNSHSGAADDLAGLDLIWRMTVRGQSVQGSCTFNPQKIRRDTVLEMTEGYAELIRMFAEQREKAVTAHE
ncbi:amino acid adenylation domain-containing protein [Paenibacillus filicis]|uniref:Amino acid adenylation domain-containing protein n=1 Tax=Paenibacillus filicis TaxID=669464 RepID=A0ABU9DGL0_9BACL